MKEKEVIEIKDELAVKEPEEAGGAEIDLEEIALEEVDLDEDDLDEDDLDEDDLEEVELEEDDLEEGDLEEVDLDEEESEEELEVVELQEETPAEIKMPKKKKIKQRKDENADGNPFEKLLVENKLKNIFDEKEHSRKKLFVPVYFVIAMLYLEFVFHIYSFKGGINVDTVAMVLFTAAISGMIGFICTLFSEKVNYGLTIFFTALFSIYFCVQIVYKGVFQNYLSLSAMMEVAGQALDYKDTIIKNILENIVALILLLAPIVIILTPVRKWIDFKRKTLVPMIVTGVSPVLTYLLAILVVKLLDNSMYSAYDVFKEYTSVDMAIEKLGVTETTVLDLGALFGVKYEADDEYEFTDVFGSIDSDDNTNPENTDTPGTDNTQGNEEDGQDGNNQGNEDEPDEPVIPKKPTNVLEINFDELIQATDDKGLISLHEYFRDCTPTKTNEYTGMFEGYNLIFITAEGFSGYALKEEYFPTLYMMANSGFVFENYYTPLWYGSTVGGEYANLTGLTPANGQYLSMKETGKRENSMRLTLATQLANIGYASVGYHNNSYTYYGRDMSHTNMGYTWMGVGNGWEPQTNKSGKNLWPQSDDYMIETTFFDYADTQPFHTYYLSVSGHVQYNFSGNAMAKKNKAVFEHLNYSDTTKAYLSCTYELEKAMTRLVGYLEEAGIAENTVIVLAPDHVPYDNKEVCDELAGYELEKNFEWFENTLIVWSASMKEPIHVDKVCSSIDILPTLSNLFGLEYDSRLVVGRDILSDMEGLVMFNNRSFITSKCKYDATNGKVTSFTDEPVDDEYVKAVKSTVKTRFRIADKILEYDYYSYIEDLFPPFEKVVPEKVAIKMGLAGFYPDGTKMTDKEHAEFIKNHPQKSEEDESTSGERLDENTPTPNLNGDAN